ncbi:hypothetical protein SAMN06265337_3666 [Hymenobacter gelipurpurascens]|uniref:Uncharacterized protein n=1 Tax=Hymenobacter gelipurpurascens TaxID=89968 RepID=A0A212UFH9_9BACT|nr:hypothetical protein SAMN06265337_3666 [Hymenobacter gelipurpurascens]
MSNYITDTLYESVIKCIFFEFTIDRWTCNTQLLHDTRDGYTTVFDSFLEYFALIWHLTRLLLYVM